MEIRPFSYGSTRVVRVVPRNSGSTVMEVRKASRNVSSRNRRKTGPLGKAFILVKAFILLFMNTSSIHGFSQITTKKRHPLESVLWVIAVSAAVWGAAKLSFTAWNRFAIHPTVVSIERNYHDWNTSFPAIAVCPTTKFTEQAITQVLERYPNVKDQSAFAEFFKGLVNGSYLTWNETLKTPFNEVDPKDFWKIVYDISLKFSYNVSNSNMENFNVLEMRQFMTDYGICYSYNSLAAPYSERGYWESNNWTYSEGLQMFNGNPLDGDIFAQVMNMNSGYTMFLLDPYEVPDVAMKYNSAENNSYKTLDINALAIASATSVQGLTINQRRCRFPHESNLETSPAYSYFMCRQECRMKLSKQLCGCVAYFYRPLDGYPVCGYNGIQCLIKHGKLLHFLSDEEKKIPCHCLPLCSVTTYVTAVDNTMAWTLGTNLKWGLVKYPKLRYKRTIIFGISDLIVAIGGTAGLFLGCSLLSFAEIVYFFTFRLVIFLCRNTRST